MKIDSELWKMRTLFVFFVRRRFRLYQISFEKFYLNKINEMGSMHDEDTQI